MPDPLCLIVSNNFPPSIGGAGTVYAALARAGGGRVHVLCASRDYRTRAALPGIAVHDAACGFPVDRIAEIRPPVGRTGRWRELGIRGRLLLRVWRLWRRHRFAVLIIADDESVGWLMAPAQRLLGLRVVLYSHGDDLGAETARLRARRARQFERADAVVAISDAAARALTGTYGLPRDRITLVPNGVDTALFRPMPPDLTLIEAYGLTGRHVILTVTRLVPRKGVDRLLEALAILLRDMPDLHYLIVGDGPQLAELRARAAQPDIAGHVSFAGAIDAADVPRHMALGEIMVMPNRRMPDGEDDGASLVFLEANACGKPVVGGIAGGAGELITHGANGLLVDGTAPADIAAAIRAILNDPALSARLAAGGRLAAEDAAWPRRAKGFLDLCARLAGPG